MEADQMRQRKEMILSLFKDKQYRPMKLKELAMLLEVSREKRGELLEVLDALLAEGKISLSARGKYGPLSQETVTGVFTGNQKGFGFVRVEGREQDVFVPEEFTKGAFHGDTVSLVITQEENGDKKAEGHIVGIVSRGLTELVGTFEQVRQFGFVIPDNKHIARDVFVDQKSMHGAVTGHKVVVELTSYGQPGKNPEGEIVEILGHMDDPGVDILSVVKAYGFTNEYPDAVKEQLKTIPTEVSSKDMAGRMDLRHLQTVTIDGEDAKDLDDAITLSKDGGIYHLGVHIADVSHYVKEGSPLDKEALRRGTSVYLVDRVIPMLPHQLSNGICSLNEGVDRLAFSCLMDIDESGVLVGHRIGESVIRVDRRMSYTVVNKIIEKNDEAESEKYRELVPVFLLMKELSEKLRERRRQRGSIDFDFPESKIILDEQGVPIEIKPYERNSATRLIEDFMLMANETVAEEYFWQEVPFLYRTHDTPDREKMVKLVALINNFGYHIRVNGEVHPKEVQKLLSRIEGSPEEAMISRLTLRSMKRARYSTDCTGHFGLAARYYTHFTSPIRRYPDLQIHRIMKEILHGQLNDRRIGHYDRILPEVAEQTSFTERQADEAERETDKMKKCQYMESRIGRCFDGVVSGMSDYGMYVELENTVEGFVHISNLEDDFYDYDKEAMEMVGYRTGNRYRLGQRVRVKVIEVDRWMNTVEFVIVKERRRTRKKHEAGQSEANADREGARMADANIPGERI
ncbi:MAG: ribonuclease R [Lachnospiraceae bacterium]|nr:ribonuclease R [Lachnospiraceae bacterium]